MKTNYIKSSLLLIVALFAMTTAKAQTSVSGKTAYNGKEYISYDGVRNENGKQVERIQTNIDDKVYKMVLVNGKMTELYVDGVKVQAADWDKYSDVIAAIREQIVKNKEQAKRNEEQARLNQIQDKKNGEQAVRNEAQARLNQIQEKKNEEQAVRNEEQARLNQIQEKKNEEQVPKNEEQARLNEIQEKKNEEQAVRNQEQARLNEIQAKKNEVQAEENERLMKQIIADLVSDKIIPDVNGLHDLTFNSDEMIINGVKQPDAVFKKYREKYSRFSKGSFSYRNE
jgi:colicin import membrane protein